MSLKKIVKVFLAAALSIGLAACSSGENEEVKLEPVKILCPTGAPGLSLLGALNNDLVTVDFVEGTDVLTAEMAKEDSEYDIIVAPTNLGAKIYTNSPNYNLDAVLTWGNLYLVGKEGVDLSTANIAAFGEGAVPGMVFKNVYDVDTMNVTWYNSVQEAQQALLTGQVDAALLAQPVAAATIAKGSEQGLNLSVVSDLQELWQTKNEMDIKGFPQASLFVKKDSEEKVSYVLDGIKTFLNSVDDEAISSAIEAVGADKLGIPNAELAVKTWKAQNINFVSGKDAKKDIEAFLKVFNMELPEGLIVE
jgi:NitT/TauT family transport system substrate-binding protein